MKKFYYCCYFLFVFGAKRFLLQISFRNHILQKTIKWGITLKHQKKQLI